MEENEEKTTEMEEEKEDVDLRHQSGQEGDGENGGPLNQLELHGCSLKPEAMKLGAGWWLKPGALLPEA